MQQQQPKKFCPNSSSRGNSLNLSFGDASVSRPVTFGLNDVSRPPTPVYNTIVSPQAVILTPNRHQIQPNETTSAANTSLVSYNVPINLNTSDAALFVQPQPPRDKRRFENEPKIKEDQVFNEGSNAGAADGSNFCIFTGNVEKVIKWNKSYDSFNCYYEVIACIISIQEGQKRMQRIVLLRDKKGPVLQAVLYSCDNTCVENIHVGQTIRCIGRMIGPNLLRVFSIRAAKSEEVATLQRLCYISDHSISRAVSVINH